MKVPGKLERVPNPKAVQSCFWLSSKKGLNHWKGHPPCHVLPRNNKGALILWMGVGADVCVSLPLARAAVINSIHVKSWFTNRQKFSFLKKNRNTKTIWLSKVLKGMQCWPLVFGMKLKTLVGGRYSSDKYWTWKRKGGNEVTRKWVSNGEDEEYCVL